MEPADRRATTVDTQSTQPVVTRFLAKHFWSSTTDPTLAGSVRFQRRAYNRASVLVRVYYAVGVLLALQAVGGWPGYADLQQASPLWPAAWWFGWFSVRTSVNLIFPGYLVASIVVAALPERRWARVAYAFTLLQYMAFINGFDKTNHNLHAWLFVGAILIFLPRGPWEGSSRKGDRQYFLTVFWSAQFVVLFFYSLTGMWKIFFAFKALAVGRTGGFNFAGFSYIVASRILKGNEDTVLGHFFVHHEIIGWALYIGTMYLEGASVLIAFRPRLHRVWGIGLILFHFATQLTMGFSFTENVVLVGLLFVCSPFVPEKVSVKEALCDLPGIHFVVRQRERARRRASPSSKPSAPQDVLRTG
jgi:hypothetical protein